MQLVYYTIMEQAKIKLTRSSADVDKPRDYRSVKITKHSRPTIPYVRYSVLKSEIVALSLRHAVFRYSTSKIS